MPSILVLCVSGLAVRRPQKKSIVRSLRSSPESRILADDQPRGPRKHACRVSNEFTRTNLSIPDQENPLPLAPKDAVRFKRSRFVARFPSDYLYSPAHFWLAESEPGVWRVGITTFAARMLGEIVEFDFEVPTGESVEVGQVVGWVEGFKATADLLSVAAGELIGGNPKAFENAELVCSDPYGDGWLYAVRGTPDPQSTDVHAYLEMLGETIDQMEEKPWQRPEMGS